MLDNLPLYIPLLFEFTVVLTLLLFYQAMQQGASDAMLKHSKMILSFLILWLIAQAAFGMNEFYIQGSQRGFPKILIFGLMPAIIVLAYIMVSSAGKAFMDSLSITLLTYIHIVRVFVELTLLLLYKNHSVPIVMTFEGRNFDIIAGLSAPLIAWYGLKKGLLNRRVILIWNILCLGLLLNIVITALLSAPTRFQQLGFEQPNIAIFYFPYCWLPSFIVPIVLFSHLASIRQLLRG